MVKLEGRLTTSDRVVRTLNEKYWTGSLFFAVIIPRTKNIRRGYSLYYAKSGLSFDVKIYNLS